jgi:hypothetical protein
MGHGVVSVVDDHASFVLSTRGPGGRSRGSGGRLAARRVRRSPAHGVAGGKDGRLRGTTHAKGDSFPGRFAVHVRATVSRRGSFLQTSLGLGARAYANPFAPHANHAGRPYRHAPQIDACRINYRHEHCGNAQCRARAQECCLFGSGIAAQPSPAAARGLLAAHDLGFVLVFGFNFGFGPSLTLWTAPRMELKRPTASNGSSTLRDPRKRVGKALIAGWCGLSHPSLCPSA